MPENDSLKAAIQAYLDRLSDMLDAIVTSNEISQEEADSLHKQAYNYAQREAIKPTFILTSLPLYDKVATFTRKSLADAAYIKSVEDEYKEWERQQGLLYEKPISVEGSPARRSRAEIISEQRMQGQNVANAQDIAEYEARQASLGKTVAAEEAQQKRAYFDAAMQRARSILTPPELEFPNQAVATAAGAAPSQNLQQFIEASAGNVAQQFDIRFPGARERWNAIAHPYRPYQGQIYVVGTPGTGEGIGTPVGGETGAWAINRALVTGGGLPGGHGYFGLDRATEQALKAESQELVAEDIKRLSGSRPTSIDANVDPLSNYLSNYPWYQEYLKIAPQQRGFFPQRYKPAATWLSG